MGAGEGESLSRQVMTPLKLGGGATFGPGLGDSGDDVEPDFSAWPACVPLLFDAGPSFSLHSSCSVTTSTGQELAGFAQQGSQTGQDAAPPSSQGSHYGVLTSFLTPHAAQEGHLALQPTC